MNVRGSQVFVLEDLESLLRGVAFANEAAAGTSDEYRSGFRAALVAILLAIGSNPTRCLSVLRAVQS